MTDPGSSLETLAREKGFGYVFLNPEDIGGRYSALSYFGLVPGDYGLDLQRSSRAPGRWRAPANATSRQEQSRRVPRRDDGLPAERGHDKACLVASPQIASFGLWAEQLIAESTGKEQSGIVPVAHVIPADPRNFDDDRVRLPAPRRTRDELDRQMDALTLAGLRR